MTGGGGTLSFWPLVLRAVEKRFDMVRLIFEEEEASVLGRRSLVWILDRPEDVWDVLGRQSLLWILDRPSEGVGDRAVSGTIVSVELMLLEEGTSSRVLFCAGALSGGNWKLLVKGPGCTFAFKISEDMEEKGCRLLVLLSESRAWMAGNSEDCLPLTGVMGSLREATVAESSSLSSGIEVVSSVGYC